MLDQLGLSHVKQPFRDNGVDGSLLVALDETVRMRMLFSQYHLPFYYLSMARQRDMNMLLHTGASCCLGQPAPAEQIGSYSHKSHLVCVWLNAMLVSWSTCGCLMPWSPSPCALLDGCPRAVAMHVVQQLLLHLPRPCLRGSQPLRLGSAVSGAARSWQRAWHRLRSAARGAAIEPSCCCCV